MAINSDSEWCNPQKIADALSQYGSVRATARAIGISRRTLRRWMDDLGIDINKIPGYYPSKTREEIKEFIVGGQIDADKADERALPARSKVKRYICTAAQNNTHLHPAWHSLKTLAAYYNAEILVSRFTYDKRTMKAKPDTMRQSDYDDLWFAPEIAPYLCDQKTALAPSLIFCGEMNIEPTAVRPLSGLASYTGRASSIFPHPKLSMQSVESAKHEATKFIYTTGAVTQINYIARKAGLKAQFHHTFGGLLVEIDSEGSWFCRHLASDETGTICDLDIQVCGDKIKTGCRVEAITWGDIHTPRQDPENVRAAWSGPDAIIDILRPKFQFFHDLVDFRARNHHDRGNPHMTFEKYIKGQDEVATEMRQAADFLQETQRPNTESIVIDSNHDNALERWLREGDYKTDPVNAIFYLECQLKKYRAIADGDINFHLMEYVLRKFEAPKNVRFLREDESFVICHDWNGGIECGMHGHLGPNGRRGAPRAFANMGRKVNVGHTHSAGIIDGVYVAGLSGKLDMGYNRGPSSWSHSHIITYPNGRRAILTIWRGKWRA